MKLLLDTNVLIDYYAQRAPFAQSANKIIAAQFFGDAVLWACPHSITDIIYILRGAMPVSTLRQMLADSFDFISVCANNQDDIKAALLSSIDDAEDALVVQCAKRIKADYIITRNTSDFKKSKVPAKTPDEWLELMKNTRNLTYDFNIDE